MIKSSINILIAEPSSVIYEGLANIINKADNHCNVIKAETLDDLQQKSLQAKIDIVIINPALIQNQVKAYNNLKKNLNNTKWFGIVYSIFDQQLISLFDGTININDTPEAIINLIQKSLYAHQHREENEQAEALSEREIEVLKLLTAGNSNKEIAEKLFISINTVITHRKNISQKTGIKSAAGLTIYAVVNHIIKLEDFDNVPSP